MKRQLWLLIVLGFPFFNQAYADLSHTQLFGTANFGFDLSSKPSSKEGETAFVLRHLDFGAKSLIDEKAELSLNVNLYEERSTTVKKVFPLLDLAQIRFLSDAESLNLGLIDHPWILDSARVYKFELWGDTSQALALRFKYAAKSDLGVSWNKKYFSDHQIRLAILNGEENRSEEKGPKKEFVFVWKKFFAESVLGLGLVYGGYEGYAPVSEKSRVLLRGLTLWGRSSFGFEALYARDPADAVTQLGLAEGVQLSAELPAQRATARGLSIWWSYDLDEKAQLLAKLDQLNPALEIADKALIGAQIAYIRQWSKSIQLICFYEQLQKQSKHSSGSPQSEKIAFSTQINF